MSLANAMSAVAAEKIAQKKGKKAPPFAKGKRPVSAEEAAESPAARKGELPPAFLKKKR